MNKPKFSELEIKLILLYSNKVGCDVKLRHSEKDKTFLLQLYVHPYNLLRPVIELPMHYWEVCHSEERKIGVHPNNGRWSSEYPFQYVETQKLTVSDRGTIIEHFTNKIK